MQPNQIEEARRMRESGQSWRAIGRAFGVRECTVMAALDPIYAERRRQMMRDWRAKNGRSLTCFDAYRPERVDPRKIPPIPRDTRDLTAFICGDPIFERSALYRKMQEQAQ